jgi:hypothetical protein
MIITRSGQNEFHGSRSGNTTTAALRRGPFFAPTRGAVDPATGEEVTSQQNISRRLARRADQAQPGVLLCRLREQLRPDAAAGDGQRANGEDAAGRFFGPDRGDSQPVHRPAVSRQHHSRASFTTPPPRAQQTAVSAAELRRSRAWRWPISGAASTETGWTRSIARVDYLFSDRHTVYARFGFTQRVKQPSGIGIPAGRLHRRPRHRTLNRAPQGHVSSTYTICAEPDQRGEGRYRPPLGHHGRTTAGPGTDRFHRHPGPGAAAAGGARRARTSASPVSGHLLGRGQPPGGQQLSCSPTNLTWIQGRHTVKTGVEYRPQQYNGRPGRAFRRLRLHQPLHGPRLRRLPDWGCPTRRGASRSGLCSMPAGTHSAASFRTTSGCLPG